MMLARITVVVFALLAAFPVPGRAGHHHLAPDDLRERAPGSHFGLAVAALEDRIVVAAESECGGAFLYDAVSGAFMRSLGEQVPCSGTFGQALAAQRCRIAVSAPADKRVYLFDANGRLEGNLSPPQRHLKKAEYDFGRSIALAGAAAVVGGARMGVHVFQMPSGKVRFRIDNPRAGKTGPDGFGAAVAITRGRVLVGDPARGVVYAFDRQSGDLRWSTTSPGVGTGFGWVLAADRGRVAVGGGVFAGHQTVFLLNARTGAVMQRYPLPKGPFFGTAVALQGRLLLVGAFTREETGIVHLYRLDRERRTAVFHVGRFHGSNTRWIAFAGNRLVVGVPGDDRVHVFEGLLIPR